VGGSGSPPGPENMKRGEKQSPELKAKVLVGMKRHFALKRCIHDFELVKIIGGAGYFSVCQLCGKYMKKKAA